MRYNITNGIEDAKISPDGQSIFFLAINTTFGGNEIYSCDIMGANVHPVVTPSPAGTVLFDLN